MNLKQKLWAFSLIELMVALLIISVATAALTPMMVKRSKDSQYSAQMKVVTSCSSYSSYCRLCILKKECLVCDRTCASSQTLNVAKCQCE